MMMKLQHELQLIIPPQGRDPNKLRGDERAEYMRSQTLALMAELFEALDETGWKPWATSRHFNIGAWLVEMVDAWHFFENLLMVGMDEAGWTLEQMADEFYKAYLVKNQKNMKRHENGDYDGLNKCKQCHRDLEGVMVWQIDGEKFCSQICADEHHDYVNMNTRERA